MQNIIPLQILYAHVNEGTMRTNGVGVVVFVCVPNVTQSDGALQRNTGSIFIIKIYNCLSECWAIVLCVRMQVSGCGLVFCAF